MDNPFKWLFLEQNKLKRSIDIFPVKGNTSECSSPTLSNRSSPGKKAKVDRFLGAKARPPLF